MTRTGSPSTSRSARSAGARLGAVALAAALALGGCATDAGPKQTAGTLIGAVAGGLAGSAIGHGTGRHIAIGAGTLLGAYLGSEVGQSLDRADRIHAARAHHEALEYEPSGRTRNWVNPDTGHSGSVTPRRTYESEAGAYCREYETTVTIDGRTETAYGTACREPDGRWVIMNG